MEIRDINIRNINIADVDIPQWMTTPPQAIPPVVPVTQTIGIPIVDVPGCVEAHEANNKSNKVGVDDENGLVTYCDAGVPSYNPINYEPEQIIPTAPAGVDTRKKETPKPPGQVELPQTASPATAKVDCPTPAQQAKEPVGTYVEGFRKKVTEYKLLGNECVQITEAVGIPQQIVAGLPSGGQVVQVGGVAVIATTSALLAKPLADLLLKVVKPAVKKTIKKIKQKLGKDVPTESLRERRGQQRSRNRAIRVLKGRE